MSKQGYGNTYPATGTDLDVAEAFHCSGVVLLCTFEAFLGLIYAGMCAAILFGKVNRVQSMLIFPLRMQYAFNMRR